MQQIIENRVHDLRTGAVMALVRTEQRAGMCQVKAVKPGALDEGRVQYTSGYKSVRAMQRELLRRNRSQIRSGRVCAVLSPEGVYFYETTAIYGYRTIQHVRLVP